MKIHEADVHDPPTPNRLPGFGKPGLLDETVNQDVEMRFAVFVKFQHRNVFGGGTIFPTQVCPELVESIAKIDDRIAFDLFGVEGKGNEPLQLQSVGYRPNRLVVSFRSARTAVGASP